MKNLTNVQICISEYDAEELSYLVGESAESIVEEVFGEDVIIFRVTGDGRLLDEPQLINIVTSKLIGHIIAEEWIENTTDEEEEWVDPCPISAYITESTLGGYVMARGASLQEIAENAFGDEYEVEVESHISIQGEESRHIIKNAKTGEILGKFESIVGLSYEESTTTDEEEDIFEDDEFNGHTSIEEDIETLNSERVEAAIDRALSTPFKKNPDFFFSEDGVDFYNLCGDVVFNADFAPEPDNWLFCDLNAWEGMIRLFATNPPSREEFLASDWLKWVEGFVFGMVNQFLPQGFEILPNGWLAHVNPEGIDLDAKGVLKLAEVAQWQAESLSPMFDYCADIIRGKADMLS